MTLKQRIASGWNFRRMLFLLIGIIYLVSSVMDGIWFGAFLSLIFIVQPILGIGCAGGNCEIQYKNDHV